VHHGNSQSTMLYTGSTRLAYQSGAAIHPIAHAVGYLYTRRLTPIHKPFLLGHRLKGQRIRTHWLQQSIPSNAQRQLWQKFIQSTYLRYGLKLRFPLGPILPKQRLQHPRLPCIDEPIHHNPGHKYTCLTDYIMRPHFSHPPYN
jgi:hypothetical protein